MAGLRKIILIFLDVILSLLIIAFAVFAFIAITDVIFRINLASNSALLGDAVKGAGIAFIYGYYKFYKTNGYFTSWLLKWLFNKITKPLVLSTQRKYFLVLIAGLFLIAIALLITKRNAIEFIADYTFDYSWVFVRHTEQKAQIVYYIGLLVVIVGFLKSYAHSLISKIIVPIKNWVN